MYLPFPLSLLPGWEIRCWGLQIQPNTYVFGLFQTHSRPTTQDALQIQPNTYVFGLWPNKYGQHVFPIYILLQGSLPSLTSRHHSPSILISLSSLPRCSQGWGSARMQSPPSLSIPLRACTPACRRTCELPRVRVVSPFESELHASASPPRTLVLLEESDCSVLTQSSFADAFHSCNLQE